MKRRPRPHASPVKGSDRELMIRAINLARKGKSEPGKISPGVDPILNSEKLAAQLHNQMRPAHVFLILSGMYVAHSEWIQYEINFARRIGRPIIGIKPWGSVAMPAAVQNGADEIVGWNSASIVDAIRRHALADE